MANKPNDHAYITLTQAESAALVRALKALRALGEDTALDALIERLTDWPE